MAFSKLTRSSKKDRSLEIAELRERIIKFKPCPEFVERNDQSNVLIIGIYGNTGVGKSSFINSLLSLTAEDKFFTRAYVSSPECQRGGSRMRNNFELTDYIMVVDNRGLDKIGDDPRVQQELEAQLDGRRGYALEVMDEGGLGNDVAGDRIHIAILIASGNDNRGLENWQNFVKAVQLRLGRTPLAVITHADAVGEKGINSVSLQLQGIGIDKRDIFTVSNVTADRDVLRDRHKFALLKMLVTCTMDSVNVVKHQQRRAFEDALKDTPPTQRHDDDDDAQQGYMQMEPPPRHGAVEAAAPEQRLPETQVNQDIIDTYMPTRQALLNTAFRDARIREIQLQRQRALEDAHMKYMNTPRKHGVGDRRMPTSDRDEHAEVSTRGGAASGQLNSSRVYNRNIESEAGIKLKPQLPPR